MKKTSKNRQTPGAPRKPESAKRLHTLTIRLTEREAVALLNNAQAAELCRNEFIARKCCQRPGVNPPAVD